MSATVRGLLTRSWRCAAAAILFLSLADVASALPADKAMYVGGTLRDFPKGGVGAQIQPTILGQVNANKVEGRINTDSDAEFVFDAGSKGTLTISYKAVVGLAYGAAPHGIPERGAFFLITWDPLDQYTNKRHYFLSIRYLDAAGVEQGVVFELGKTIVRPTLATLEARTGHTIEFPDVEACLLHRAAEQCGYGTPSELRGMTKIFIDAGTPEYRELIVAEIEKGRLGVEVLPSPDGAEVVLRFRGEEFRRPDYLQRLHGGRGEAAVMRDGRSRVVLVFAATRMRAWGDKPATKFGAAFVEAYRHANSRSESPRPPEEARDPRLLR